MLFQTRFELLQKARQAVRAVSGWRLICHRHREYTWRCQVCPREAQGCGWVLCPLVMFFNIQFLRLVLSTALMSSNADIISAEEGLCGEWQQRPQLPQCGGKSIGLVHVWCDGQSVWVQRQSKGLSVTPPLTPLLSGAQNNLKVFVALLHKNISSRKTDCS